MDAFEAVVRSAPAARCRGRPELRLQAIDRTAVFRFVDDVDARMDPRRGCCTCAPPRASAAATSGPTAARLRLARAAVPVVGRGLAAQGKPARRTGRGALLDCGRPPRCRRRPPSDPQNVKGETMAFELPALPYPHERPRAAHRRAHHGDPPRQAPRRLHQQPERRPRGHPALQARSIEELLRGFDARPRGHRRRPSATTAAATPTTTCSGRSWAPRAAARPERRAGRRDRRRLRFASTLSKTTFADAAAKRFGSGWAWLVVDGDGELQVYSTANQDIAASCRATRPSWAWTCGSTPTT